MPDQQPEPKANQAMSRGTLLAFTLLVALTLIMGGGNLWATYAQVHDYKASQARQQAGERAAGVVIEQKLCATFGAIAALKPPPGSASANPSRAYEQRLHATLSRIGPDLGCSRH